MKLYSNILKVQIQLTKQLHLTLLPSKIFLTARKRIFFGVMYNELMYSNVLQVLLMKKQITEIEREIIEKGNRSSSVAVNSSTTPVTTVAAVSQSTNCKVTSSSSLTNNQFNVPAEKQTVDSRTADIDLESLDPLGALLFCNLIFENFSYFWVLNWLP